MVLKTTKKFIGLIVRFAFLLALGLGMSWLGVATAYRFMDINQTTAQMTPKDIEVAHYNEAWRFDNEAAVQGGTLEGLVWLNGQGFVAAGNGPGPDGAGTYLSPVLEAQTPVRAVVAEWAAGSEEKAVQLALRWRVGETWSDWVEFHEDHEMPPLDGQISTPLLLPDANALQWRMLLPPGQTVQRVAIGTVAVEPGPDAEELSVLAAPLPDGGPVVISRAEWGAPATVPWEPEPNRPRAIVVHHTATGTGSNNPAAVVRAVDVYHRVTRGWGDIGYHYLIDHQGRIYAGRVGGPESIGAHAYDYNNGTVGIALIGTHDSAPISPAARNSLVSLTAWLSRRYRINPEGSTTFYNRPYATIMGHRHTGRQTTCPGQQLVNELPQLRRLVAQRLAGIVPPYPPGIQLAPAGDWVRGTVTVAVAPQDSVPTQYTLLLDGKEVQAGTAAFQYSVDTTTLTDGEHTLVAVAQQGALSSQSEMPLRVDNRAPSITTPSIVTTEAVTVTLGDETSGIAQATLRRQDGSGTWSEWSAIEGPFPTRRFDSVVRFESAAALQWRATDRAGNATESSVVTRGLIQYPLAIESLEILPAQPQPGVPFAVQVMVVNRGSETTSEAATLTVRFGTERTLSWRIDAGLPAGATVLLRNSDRNVLPDSTFKGTLPAGEYQLEAVVQSAAGESRWEPRQLIVREEASWRVWISMMFNSQTASP
jgi:hypothetical protein